MSAESREYLLEKARTVVAGEREDTYGGPEDSFQRIANLWNAAFDVEYFTPESVAIALSLVKVARLMKSPDHEDSWVDLAGYAACGFEVSLKDVALEKLRDQLEGIDRAG